MPGIQVFGAVTTDAGLVEALTETANAILDNIKAVGPIALGVAGAFLIWRYGMRFFKSVSK